MKEVQNKILGGGGTYKLKNIVSFSCVTKRYTKSVSLFRGGII